MSRKVVSGAQIRAARGLLGWSSQELAKRSGVGWSTIKRFEDVQSIPRSRAGTLERVQLTLENQGVKFIGDPINAGELRHQ